MKFYRKLYKLKKEKIENTTLQYYRITEENSTKLPEFIGAKIQYNNKEFVYIHSVECLGHC